MRRLRCIAISYFVYLKDESSKLFLALIVGLVLGYTPLHFACGRGHHMVVKTLLEIGDIDHKARDKSQRSPLDLCKSSQSFAGPTGESLNLCQRYLKAHAERDPMTLSVLMPDGSEKCVVLESGSNTTAGHILTQLNLTSQTSLMFALSVTSDALTIQLRPEIKPLHVCATLDMQVFLK